MTHHNDPFEYSEYKRNEHNPTYWPIIIIAVVVGIVMAFVITKII